MGITTDREEFERVWPYLEPALAEDVGNHHSKEDVWTQIEAKNVGLWTTPNSATLVNPIIDTQGWGANVWASGGSLKEILGITYPEVDQWVRECGGKFLMGAGRPAWERPLKKLGFKPKNVTFVKEY